MLKAQKIFEKQRQELTEKGNQRDQELLQKLKMQEEEKAKQEEEVKRINELLQKQKEDIETQN